MNDTATRKYFKVVFYTITATCFTTKTLILGIIKRSMTSPDLIDREPGGVNLAGKAKNLFMVTIDINRL